ncbi:MAG: hypothetical protein RIE24_20300 [Silicimonas sp.]
MTEKGEALLSRSGVLLPGGAEGTLLLLLFTNTHGAGSGPGARAFSTAAPHARRAAEFRRRAWGAGRRTV